MNIFKNMHEVEGLKDQRKTGLPEGWSVGRGPWGRVAAVLVLMATPAWAHPPVCKMPCRAPCANHESPADGAAVLELTVGLATRYVGVGAAGQPAREVEVAPLVALTPALEWRFGRRLFAGLEVGFASTEDPTSVSGRRSITLPGVRGRMTFSVARHLEADAVFGAGVAFWAGEGGPILVGWTRRMAFGGAYEVAEDLWAQLHLGSSVVVAGPAGKGLLSGEYTVQQPVGVSGLTVTMGVRSGW